MKKGIRVVLTFIITAIALGFLSFIIWGAICDTASEYSFSKPVPFFFILLYIAAVFIVTYYLTRDKES